VADVEPRRREVIREPQWRIVFEKFSRLQSNIDVFHVSLATSIGKNSKTCHSFIGNPFARDRCHMRLLLKCERNRDQLLKPLGNESGRPLISRRILCINALMSAQGPSADTAAQFSDACFVPESGRRSTRL